MTTRPEHCPHTWGASSGVSHCAKCGSLRSFFPGGDRGEKPFETVVPAHVMSAARAGQLEGFVAALPDVISGAWWLSMKEWWALLRSIHADLDAWRAALQGASSRVSVVVEALDAQALNRGARRRRSAPELKPAPGAL